MNRGTPLLCILLCICAGTVNLEASPTSVQVFLKPIDFGALYDTGSFNGTGAVIVNAPVGLGFRVSIDRGLHYSAGSRHLKKIDGSELIPYVLYSDAACTLRWGESDLGAKYVDGGSVSGTGTGGEESMTVFGRLTVPSFLPPGSYADSITIYVEY